MNAAARAWAIVPAAGRSARMGQPKLLLPWGSSTVIEQVIAAWRASRVSGVVAVVHPDDVELAEVCRRAGAEVVVAPSPPPDMKASVCLGLESIAHRYAPRASDAWLVAPADLPTLSAETINRVIAAHATNAAAASARIVVPVHNGRRGHPVLFPWLLAEQVKSLPEDAGLNRLLSEFSPQEIDCGAEALPADLDTPDDYRRLHDRHNPS